MQCVAKELYIRIKELPQKDLPIQYCQAFATGIDFKKKEIACADVYEHYENNVKLPRSKFNLSYDKLVLAVGM